MSANLIKQLENRENPVIFLNKTVLFTLKDMDIVGENLNSYRHSDGNA